MKLPPYPLRFEPIFRSMMWGGDRLPRWLGRPAMPEPVGEAWVLSDVEGSSSVISNGPLATRSLRELMEQAAEMVLGGAAATAGGRFPLLLKFIDAQRELSVQVHPNDEQARRLGPLHRGKTEAWVVLDRDPHRSRIYAGLAEGVTAEGFAAAMARRRVAETLHQYVPDIGDCLLLEAGTVHALGAGLFVFEVQQSSDITYRLYDWDRVDERTGQPRPLHVAEAMACIDWTRGPVRPVAPAVTVVDGVRREGLVRCRYFTLERVRSRLPWPVARPGRCRIVVGLEGHAELVWSGRREPFSPGDVVLLPAALDQAMLVPRGEATVLECGLSDDGGSLCVGST